MIPYQNKDIETYVASLTHLQKELLLPIREAVLNADSRVKEGIKWGSICFFSPEAGGNICGYRVAQKHVTLLFMEGAALKDEYSILEGTGAKARTYKNDGTQPVPVDALQDLVKQAFK